MFDFDLSETIVLKGYWHLPDNSNNKIFGHFTYKPNQDQRVLLEGTFNGNKHPFAENPTAKISLIHGFSQQGHYIHLYNCSFHENRRWPGYNQTVIFFELVIISKAGWIIIPSQSNIAKLHLKLDCLQDLFRTTFNLSKVNNTKYYEAESSQEYLPIHLYDGDNYSISIGYHQTVQLPGRNEISEMRFQIFVSLEFKFCVTSEVALKELRFIRDYFTTILTSEVAIENVKLELVDNSAADLIFIDPIYAPATKMDMSNQYFVYNRNLHLIKSTLKFWLSNSVYFTETGALYATINYKVVRLSEHKLITTMFALESFIAFFLPDINGKDSLIKKIHQARKNLEIEFLLINFDVTAKNLVDYRNYLAHLTPTKLKPIQDNQIGYYCTIARIIYESFVLRKMGLEQKTINQIVNSNLSYSYWLQNPSQ